MFTHIMIKHFRTQSGKKCCMRYLKLLIIVFFAIPILSLAQNHERPVAISACKILEKKSHNPKSFTQGFVMDTEYFYESSGHYSASFLARYLIEANKSTNSDEQEKNMRLPNDIFAEGLTLLNDNLFLITWKKGIAYQLDKKTLTPIKTFRYSGEGWGLTHNTRSLIMSDGSHTLRYFNPNTFQLEKTLSINNAGKPLNNINELEFHDGIIWANKWYSDTIYGIEEESGHVIITINCKNLRSKSGVDLNKKEHVFNGIAYDPVKKGLWVTGKYWHSRFLIEIPALIQHH